MVNRTEEKFKKFTWHNLSDNDEANIRYLRDNFSFTKQNLVDVATPPLRPKIEFYDDYIFIILLFPIYNRKNQAITSTEFDLFLSKDYLITIHKNHINSIKDYEQKIQTKPEFREKYNKKDSLYLALDILEESILDMFPMLNHIAWDIDSLDSQLFSGKERELINKILSIKRNIVDIRKSMQSHRDVFSELSDSYRDYFTSNKAEHRLKSIKKYTGDVWDQLENHKQTIDAIQETNESLITFRLNDIMKTLTIFSVIVFPLTLLAAIFGMNTIESMPFVNSPGGFWKVIIIMVVGTMIMFYYFRKHRWI